MIVLAFAALTACGSPTVHELPPAAEPPRSPPLSTPAAGRLIRVGAQPEGIVVDAATHRLAVGLREPPALAIVDPQRGAVVRRIALPGAPRHLAVVNGTVLVPAEMANTFLAVGLARGAIIEQVRVGAYPHDLAAVAGGAVAVGDERANTLSLVRGGRVVRTAPVATQPGGVTALDHGRLVAVISVRERVLELYDAHTLRRLHRAAAGVGPTHIACLDLGPCYVTDTQGGALLVFSPAGRGELRLRRRVYLPGGPYGIALDARHRRLYVTLTARNQLVELPAHGRPHVLRRWPTVRQPDSVAVDPAVGRAYVTGRASGTVQVLRVAAPR